MTNFQRFGLSKNLNQALIDIDFIDPTPIQSKTDLQTYLEPSILSKSQNLTQGEISIYFENRKKEGYMINTSLISFIIRCIIYDYYINISTIP